MLIWIAISSGLHGNVFMCLFFVYFLLLHFFCSKIVIVFWDHRLLCCSHLKIEFRSCARGSQLCGIFITTDYNTDAAIFSMNVSLETPNRNEKTFLYKLPTKWLF